MDLLERYVKSSVYVYLQQGRRSTETFLRYYVVNNNPPLKPGITVTTSSKPKTVESKTVSDAENSNENSAIENVQSSDVQNGVDKQKQPNVANGESKQIQNGVSSTDQSNNSNDNSKKLDSAEITIETN